MNQRLLSLMVLLACAGGMISPETAVSRSQRECVDEMTWSYDQHRFVARFKVNLPACWGSKNGYKVKAWIEHSEATAVDPQRVVEKRVCDPTKVCRVRVAAPHPIMEAASYRASIEYMATSNGVQISHRVFTCASTEPEAHCHQP